jgi:hypothetical protein
MNRFKSLNSNVAIYTAAMNQTPIVAYFFEERVGEGIIHHVDDLCISLRDCEGTHDWYVRGDCIFFVK